MTDTIKVSREEEVSVPTGQRMMVDVADWARLRRRIGRLGEPIADHATTWAATAVGASIGLGVTAIVLERTASRVEPGVIPCLWVAVGFLVLFAICFGLAGRVSQRHHTVYVHDVCEEMDEVAERLGHEGLGANDAQAQAGPLRGALDRFRG